MKQKLNLLVKVLILAGMLLGGVLIVFAARYMLTFSSYSFTPEELTRIYIAGALAIGCVLGCEYIAIVLFSMMRTLDSDPFVAANVTALRRMGVAALAIMACGLLTLAIWPVPLAILAALPVGMCGLFSLVLSSVFARAVAFKEENDLTV